MTAADDVDGEECWLRRIAVYGRRRRDRGAGGFGWRVKRGRA
jgi:hypothetical protein